jgi:hypothetical protein
MFRHLLAFFAGCISASASITNCGQGSRFDITTLALHPDPPIPGKHVDMTVQFTNPGSEVTDGTATTSVTLNFIPFQPTVKPLCEDTHCPFVTGANDRSTSSIWPETVTGAMSSKIVWTDVDGSELLCISIKTKVVAEEGVKFRFRSEYNQTHAEVVAVALRLNDPVAYESMDESVACFDCNATWVSNAQERVV